MHFYDNLQRGYLSQVVKVVEYLQRLSVATATSTTWLGYQKKVRKQEDKKLVGLGKEPLMESGFATVDTGRVGENFLDAVQFKTTGTGFGFFLDSRFAGCIFTPRSANKHFLIGHD